MKIKSSFILFNLLIIIFAVMLLQGCAPNDSHIDTSLVDHALVIGLSEYEKEIPSTLAIAQNDAVYTRNTLLMNTGILSENLEVVIGERRHITKSGLLSKLHRFAQRSNKNDVVWISIIGRRVIDHGQYYLRVYDSVSEDGKPVPETYVNINSILLALKEMQAKTLIVSFTFVMEGTDATNINKTPFKSINNVPPKELSINIEPIVPQKVSSEVIVMSWEENEISYGEKGKIPGTFFSLFLREGLSGAASQGNEYVSIGGLLRYMQDNLFAYSDSTLPTQNAIWKIYSKNRIGFLETRISNKSSNRDSQYIWRMIKSTTNSQSSQRALLLSYQANIAELCVLQHLIATGQISSDRQIKGTVATVQAAYQPIIQKLRDAIKIDPNLANMWLGKMLERRGSLDEAENRYRQAINYASSDRRDGGEYQLATLLVKKKKYAEAKKLLNGILNRNPNNILARNELKRLNMQEK